MRIFEGLTFREFFTALLMNIAILIFAVVSSSEEVTEK